SNHLPRDLLVPGTPIIRLFEMTRPQITLDFDNICNFINAVFVLQARTNPGDVRRHTESDSQMMMLSSNKHIIYLCSPYVTSIPELLQFGMRLTAMPLHDATRDIILLNQQRLSDVEVNLQLEASNEQLETMARDLEKEREKTETLLHDLLPPAVAIKFLNNEEVEAIQYDEASVMLTDVPQFVNIVAKAEPKQIVTMLNDLFTRFDRLIGFNNNIYKVETVGDCYMTVAGIPEPVPDHCEILCHLAIGMLWESREVHDPRTDEPLMVRIGIHSGQIVAGVVGEDKPRYAMYGDAINTASRMESHSLPGRIQLSAKAHLCASRSGRFEFVSRGRISVKVNIIYCNVSHPPLSQDKGEMETYFLQRSLKKSVWEIVKRPRDPAIHSIEGYDELMNACQPGLIENRVRVVLFFSLFVTTNSYKFLAYNPQFATSHVNFISKLADALIDEGHQVVMVSPRMDTTVGSPHTKATTAQSSAAAAFQVLSSAGLASVWKSSNILTEIKLQYRPMFSSWIPQCNTTLSEPNLIDALREEQFDAAFTESLDACGYVLFHALGIDKYATTVSLALLDGQFGITQVPVNTAYVPSMMGGKEGDQMSIVGRFLNTLTYRSFDALLEEIADLFQNLLDDCTNYSTNIRGLMANSSLVFFNSDPLADFPKLTSSRVIDIGGISVHAGHKAVDQHWSNVLNLRNRTILLSFGTFVKAHLMPSRYRESIREVIRRFPDVTFIVKYEKPEHNFSAGLANVIEIEWAPQHDLLHDRRLTAFVTHGGQGSITEASEAGVPLVCVPVTADQFRNARQVERNGVGVMLGKEELAEPDSLQNAITVILNDSSYRMNARKLALSIADRPFGMKDIFVRNMEFLVKHGPHRRFDHFGTQMSFVQYYLLDIMSII
ncbi:hypothetical protein PFISCL1PPCAC_14439, partial [Pristionchus fissidentatus]